VTVTSLPCKFCGSSIESGTGRLYVGIHRYRFVVRACPGCVWALVTWRPHG
jgi:ribosomal protein L24E